MFQILADCSAVSNPCKGLDSIVLIVKNGVLPIIQIGIPILLIIMGSIDLGKAVLSSDEKAVKAAQSMLIKRVISAVAVFLVVTIVTVVMNLLTAGNIKGDSWEACWQCAGQNNQTTEE